jgi:hypothetical protein
MDSIFNDSSSSKVLFQKFLKFFTIIPKPPVPNKSLIKSELYFKELTSSI